jgi:hypothetical protein
MLEVEEVQVDHNKKIYNLRDFAGDEIFSITVIFGKRLELKVNSNKL